MAGEIVVFEVSITDIYGKEMLAQIQGYALQLSNSEQVKHRSSVDEKGAPLRFVYGSI